MIQPRRNLAILLLLAAGTTASAAAPHIIIYHGSKLPKSIVIDNWEQNHRLMASLGEEGLVRPEETSAREYLELSMFWGPEWINYKFDGGTNTLRPEQGNQRARLYLGTKNTPPILHMEGRKPRYIGKDGVVMLTEHGIPTRTTIAQNAFHSLKDPWLLGLTIALLISTTITFLILRQVRTKS